MDQAAPIIFIHYGNSDYLEFTLPCAKTFNPDKRVILIGNEENQHFTQHGIEHHLFEDYAESPEIELFEKVFRFVAGDENKRQYWTHFNFKKWMVLYNFVTRNGFEKFWIFDSDNMLIEDLSNHEAKFAEYDSTEQCYGMCMNGLVNNTRVLKGYVNKINELFQREEYIALQREEFKKFPEYVYTMMRAYITFKEESTFKTVQLNTIINDETFDDAICQYPGVGGIVNSNTNGMEMRQVTDNKWMKNVYLSDDGQFFNYHEPTGKLIRLIGINMSWVPWYLFPRVLDHAKKKLHAAPLNSYSKDSMSLMSHDPDKVNPLRKAASSVKSKIKKLF